MKKQVSYSDYITTADNIQLRFNFNIEVYVKDNGKVQLVQNIIERMNLNKIFNQYKQKGRKPSVNPITMLKIILFCYSEGIYSTRKIEKMCKYDLRVMYLLNQEKAPDHATISRYQQRLKTIIQEIFEEFTILLINQNLIDLSSIYIDGTKIESVANKYSFVWRKSIEKNKEKLIQKIKEKLGIKEEIEYKQIKKKVKQEYTKIKNKCKKEKIEFVKGKGKKKTKEQRDYEQYKEYIQKLETYDKHLKTMGKRNSYSKTDKEATFMRMKEDHMKNGQLKPGYNIQYASTGNFIIGTYISQNPSDMYTLKPFLKQLTKTYEKNLDKIVADAGYESEENYDYIEKKRLRAFIKPSNYEQQKTKKYKEKLKEREELRYNKQQDYYEDKEGKKFVRVSNKISKKASGYKSVSKVYKCFEWNKGGQKTKSYYFTDKFEKYRKQSEENIKSQEGIDERINRSIQAEGVFSKLKDGLGYKRFRHKGKENIQVQMILMGLAININTLLSKIQKEEMEPTRYTKAS